jgi:hypothetical protein
MPRAGVSASVAPKAYPTDLGPEIQRALAALADVETRYEVECEQVDRWSGPMAWKDRVRAGIEARICGSVNPSCSALPTCNGK